MANHDRAQPAWLRLSPRARSLGAIGGFLLVIFAFFDPLIQLVDHALHADLDSYILLIPFISGYLLHLRINSPPRVPLFSSPAWAGGFAAAGVLAVVAAWTLRGGGDGDFLACTVLAFVCAVTAVAFLFLGREWVAKAAFPIGFLFFMVPLPGEVIAWLENGLKVASAEVAALFFQLSGTPNVHDGVFFQLPTITLEVASECSGIRSSLVLFIAGLLAAHLFLHSTWRKILLVAFVIPIGILRNGFRIWTIGQLCVYVGPEMINSVLHKHGGPLFFAISLVPLLLLVWWLRRGENKRMNTLKEKKLS